MAPTRAAAVPESSDSASSYASSEAAAYQEFSGSDADSAYSSSEEEEAEQEEKEGHRSPLSPKKMAVFPAAPKSPPPFAVSSVVDEREDEDEDGGEDDDGVEDGSSNQEFAEGETDKPELKMQPRFSSDPDSSDETPPPAPNPPPSAVSSKDDEDGSKDEDGEEDGSSGESDDGEAIRCLPSLDSSPLDTSSPHLNPPSHNSQDLKSSSTVSVSMTMNTPPEPIKHAGSALPARCSFKRKHAEIDNSEENDNRSRKRFQKLWALDDEIALLNGLVKYLGEKGTVPFSVNDMDSVRLLINSSFHLDVSNKQLADKVRRLKKKFQINSARLKNKVSSIVFDDHEQSLYDLSNKLWSVKTIPPTKKVANVNSSIWGYAEESRQKPKVKKLNSDDASTHLKVSERTIQGTLRYPLLWETVSKLADGLSCGASMKKAFEMVDDIKANVIEKKLKKLRLNEMRHRLNGVNLNMETMKFIIESLQG